jgi:magnesium chelatase family protein
MGMVGSDRPGEIALANRGVLLLDEVIEFRQDVIEAVWDAVRRGEVQGRTKLPTSYPSQMVVMASDAWCYRHRGKDECPSDGHTDANVRRLRQRVGGMVRMWVEMEAGQKQSSPVESFESRRARVTRASKALARGQKLKASPAASSLLMHNSVNVHVARVIALLEGESELLARHVDQAMRFRVPDGF